MVVVAAVVVEVVVVVGDMVVVVVAVVVVDGGGEKEHRVLVKAVMSSLRWGRRWWRREGAPCLGQGGDVFVAVGPTMVAARRSTVSWSSSE